MSIHRLLLLILCTFWWGNFLSFSQPSTSIFKNITIEEGLSHNSVIDIAQDSLGFMWFATRDGLNRYDGKNFKIYPKIFDDITSAENYRLGKLDLYDNHLWMITRGGKLEILNLPTDKIKEIKHFSNKRKIPTVRSIFQEGREKIWIGTEEEGVFLVDSKMEILQHYNTAASPSRTIISNKINSIFKDSEKNIWILTNKGVNKITQLDKVETYLKNLYANTITEDSAGLIFVGTQGESVYVKYWYNSDFEKFKMPRSQSLPGDLVVRSVLSESDYFLWVGTYGNGLYYFNRANSTFIQYLPETENAHSIAGQDILSIFKDDKNEIWIGTDGGGISYHAETFRNFNSLTPQQAPDDVSIGQVRAIATDSSGAVWIGTSANGIIVFDRIENKFQTINLNSQEEDLKNYNRIMALDINNDGDVWVGTYGSGALIVDSNTNEVKKRFTKENSEEAFRLPDNHILTFLKECDNTYWAGTRYSGLLLLNKDKGLIKAYSVTGGSKPENLRTIERINDSLLAVGYDRKGLKIFNIRKGSFVNLLRDLFREKLDEVEIKSLYYKNGWLWVGTGGKGLVVIQLRTGIVKHFTEKDGLPDGLIYGILEEDSRTLWMSSNKGIFRLIYKKTDCDLKIEKIESYDKSVGLQSNQHNTGAFHKSKDGIIYFGGIKGISYFKPEEIPQFEEAYNVVITEAIKDNMPLQGLISIPYLDEISLPYSENSIALNYTAINFISPEKLNYTYKLEGYDEDWIEAGSRDYTAYTNLPPGDYEFKVRLADNMIDDPQHAALRISIASPFWYSWWFILFLLLLIISLIYSFYRFRIYQFMELQKVKDGISADLHDDLGSRLTTIHLLSAITKKKFTKNPELSNVLRNIEKEIFASSEALDEIVWNIKMTDESLPDIIAKIRRYVSEVLENDKIIYSFESSANFEHFKLSMRKRRELFLISKELISNIRKHSHATEVEFVINPDGNNLYMSVFDNGKGFDPNQITHRNGILNIKKRILTWNGGLKIRSEPGEGCRIELWIPFDTRNYLKKIFPKQ